MLGLCKCGELPTAKRYNEVRSLIASALQDDGYDIQEVFGCSNASGIRQNRHFDYWSEAIIRLEDDLTQLEDVYNYEPTKNAQKPWIYSSKYIYILRASRLIRETGVCIQSLKNVFF